jgi:hypothetical protein
LQHHFFGLSPVYRKQFFTQIHDLVYHGNGGFIHSEVYNMPIWLRKFHIQSINDFQEKQQEEYNKAKGESNIGDDGKIFGPGVTPSSYNFNK